MKTLSKYEVMLLTAFAYQHQQWQREHNNHADVIKIDYDADDGYLIETGAPKSKRKRTTRFETDIITWVDNQLFTLGYERVRTKTLILNYENGEFSIAHTFELAEEVVTIDDEQDSEQDGEASDQDGEHSDQDGEHSADDTVEIES